MAAGRISYTFGLKGPSVPVETACSSSLVSLSTAFNAIKLGQCPCAFNGGSNLILIPSTTAMFQKAGMLALDGRCKTLSSAADGYVRSDACGTMLLLPTESTDKACIPGKAFILSAAVNQDGRSSSLTAPNGPAQQEVINAAFHAAAKSPMETSALQMHGTGTSLGDPIEVGALVSGILCNQTTKEAPLALMAAKSWSGHAEAGAGMVGLIHAQAAVAKNANLSVMHLADLNPYVQSALKEANGRVAISRNLGALPTARYKSMHIVGVSAFAFQGTNAHSLVQSIPDCSSMVKSRQKWEQNRIYVAPLTHAGLGSCSVGNTEILVDSNILEDRFGYLWDHQVMGKVLYPGAGFFELGLAAGYVSLNNKSNALYLERASIPSPFIMPKDLGRSAVTARVTLNIQEGLLRIASNPGSFHLISNLFATKAMRNADSSPATRMIPSCLNVIISLSSERYGRSNYGSVDNSTTGARDVFFSPAALDCILQLGAIPRSSSSSELKIPAGAEIVAIPRQTEGDNYHCTALEASSHGKISELQYSIRLNDESHSDTYSKLLLQSKGLSSEVPQNVAKPTLAEFSNSRYFIEWDASKPIGDLAGKTTEAAAVQRVSVSFGDHLRAVELCNGILSTLQCITSGDIKAKALSLLTSGALPAIQTPSTTSIASQQSCLWSLWRSVKQEMPNIGISAHDYGINMPKAQQVGANLCIQNEHLSGDAYGATECGKIILQAILQQYRNRYLRDNKRPSYYGSHGDVAISGGTGSLGSLVGLWWSNNLKNWDICLIGRSGKLGSSSHIFNNILFSTTSEIIIKMSDTGCREDAKNFVSEDGRHVPYSAFVHSGGLLADSIIVNQNPSKVRTAFAPKMESTLLTRIYSDACPNKSEFLFSSVASLLGSPGQTNYAGANGALDWLSVFAQQQGKLSYSIQWGAWTGAGMAANDSSTVTRVERLGIGMVNPVNGLEIISDIIARSPSISIISAIPFRWNKFLDRIQSLENSIPEIFSNFSSDSFEIVGLDSKKGEGKKTVFVGKHLLEKSKHRNKPRAYASNPSSASHTTYKILPEAELLAEITSLTRGILGKEIATSEPLMAAGLDSLSSVEFRNSIETKLGIQLPSTLVFDYPTIDSIVKFLRQQGSGTEPIGTTASVMEKSNEKLSQVKVEVSNIASSILGVQVESTTPLMSAGLDSLSAVEFRNSIEHSLGIQLPPTLIFDYPTIDAISSLIIGNLSPISNEAQDFNEVIEEGELVMEVVLDAAKSVLRVDMDPDQKFSSCVENMDSLTKYSRALGARLGVVLPSAVIDSEQTPNTLVQFLLNNPFEIDAKDNLQSEINRNDYGSAILEDVVSSRHASPDIVAAPVAVIAMSSRMPGDILAFGNRSAFDGCCKIGTDRWDVDSQTWLTGDMPVRFGGLLSDVGFFDASAFALSDKEAILMDPQQRLLLESVSETLGQASVQPKFYEDGFLCGVFVGCSSHDYAKLSRAHTGVTAYTGTGTTASVVSGRVSYTFGLKGPALTIDTACSSSLSGTHIAFDCLQARQCHSAAASGVNLLLHPETLAVLQKAGMLAQDGRCKTLSAEANGYVRAECIGTMLLKLQGVLVNDCLALVVGSAVNQDGRSSSLTAPNGPAQQQAILFALEASGLAPHELSALQMHGTGTALGDPIEIGAANSVLIKGERRIPLALLASKSWMGHSEPAAGIAGLAHSHVALNSCTSLPILHLRSVNEYVSTVLGNSTSWFAGRQSGMLCDAKSIGTSAFAFQGTNAHVIIQSLGQVVDGALPASATARHLTRPFRREYYWLAPIVHR